MKKFITLLLIPVFLLLMALAVIASHAPKTREVVAFASSYEVNVGETVDLKFTTVKHGSTFVDTYNGALKVETI